MSRQEVEGLAAIFREAVAGGDFDRATSLLSPLLLACKDRLPTPERPAVEDCVYVNNHGAVWEIPLQNWRSLLERLASGRAYNLEAFGTCLPLSPVKLHKMSADTARFELSHGGLADIPGDAQEVAEAVRNAD